MNKSDMLNEIKEHLSIASNVEFSEYLGIKPNTLSNWHSRNTFDAELIFTKCEWIDPSWLLSGIGEMVNTYKPKESSANFVNDVMAKYGSNDKNEEYQAVPLYDLTASASVLEVFTEHSKLIPLEHIQIPNLPKCDGAIHITGDSMYPILKSGDIVLYREVQNKQNIIWGEMYVIYINDDGDEFFFVKYVQKSDRTGYVKLVSQNQHHQPVEFKIDSIIHMAIVKASIRMNSQI